MASNPVFFSKTTCPWLNEQQTFRKTVTKQLTICHQIQIQKLNNNYEHYFFLQTHHTEFKFNVLSSVIQMFLFFFKCIL